MRAEKERSDVPEELVDEIVDEILAETAQKSPSKNTTKPKAKEEMFLDNGMSDLSKLKLRMQNIENRIENHVHDYKTTAVEVERQIVDKFSEFEQENEKRLIYLQGQLESLRNAMIRLSSEFRQLKESISSQKR